MKPKRGRSSSGYRLYRDSDLARLEQIVVLKFLGLRLREIGRLMKRQSPLVETLRRQQLVLAEKRQQLDAAISAIDRAERSLRSADRGEGAPGVKKDPGLGTLRPDCEGNRDAERNGVVGEILFADAQAKVEERKKLWNPELQAQVTRNWNALIADVTAAVKDGEPVSSPRAQALATRWRKLVEGFTGGDPEVQKGLNRMWADQTELAGGFSSRYSIRSSRPEFHRQCDEESMTIRLRLRAEIVALLVTAARSHQEPDRRGIEERRGRGGPASSAEKVHRARQMADAVQQHDYGEGVRRHADERRPRVRERRDRNQQQD